MAYKVLGQTSATAAAAATTLNLVKDPSFEGLSIPITQASDYINRTSSVLPNRLSAESPWSFAAMDSYNNGYMTFDKTSALVSANAEGNITKYFTSVSMPAGSNAILITKGTATAQWGQTVLRYGCASTNTVGDLTDAANFSRTLAIPVTAGTTYYFGASVALSNSAHIGMNRIQYCWYAADGSVVSSGATSDFLTDSDGNSTWQRKTATVTAPAGAAFLNFQFKIELYNYNYQYQSTYGIDAVVFSTSSTAASTFPNPNDTATAYSGAFTSPFTSRYSAGYSGTVNNSTTVTQNAGAATLLYTVPAGKSTVVSTLTAVNPTLASTPIRVAVVPSGETLAMKNFIVFDIPLSSLATTTMTLGMTLAAGDKIYVSADSGNVQFTAFGSES